MPYEDDHYTLEREVGRGGAGRVFLAYDGTIGREVALKEVDLSKARDHSVRERMLKRFLREAKLTAQLEHPGIVPVYDLKKREDGSTYYVMKYVRGKTFAEAIKECESDQCEEGVQKRLMLIGQLIDVCEAMAYAHSKGIIHRDLKPGNIVLGEFGETIILDWGLAKRVGDEEEVVSDELKHIEELFDDELTKHGTMLGTPSFMAPEQAAPRFGSVDEQSDVYALGVLLFYLLTGEKVYKPGGRRSLVQLTSDDPTPSPKTRSACLPPELVAICEKATAKEKNKRFNDAREMAHELRAFRDGRLVTVYAYSRRELFRRFLARNKAVVIATTLLVIAIIVGAGFSFNFAVEAHRARARAERALVDISSIAEEAMSIARKGVRGLESYKKAHGGSLVGAAQEITKLFGFDPTTSPFQVWAMGQDGQILYDEDQNQVGKFLFNDAMYANFPELKRFGARMQEEPWGMGYYSFYDREGDRVIYKIAAWDTVESTKEGVAKIVVTHPYDAHQHGK